MPRIWFLLVLLVIAATVFARVNIATAEYGSIIWMPDDAYYYLVTARQVLAGHGLTFDGTNPASGFHPLWLAWCVATGGSTAAAAAGGMMFACASALLLWFLLRRLQFDPALAALGAVMLLLNPRLAINSINGLETALVTFLWLLLVADFADWRGGMARGWLISRGLLGGLLWLARTDMLFTLVAMVVYAGWRLPPAARGRGLAWFLAGLAPLPLLWLGFHLWQFGSIFAASADAMPYVVRHTDALAVQGLTGHLQCGLGKMRELAVRWEFITGWALATPLTLFLLGALGYRAARADGELRWRYRLLALLWAAAISLILTHAMVRLHPSHWYFETTAVLMLLTAAMLAGELAVIRKASAVRLAVVCAAVAAGAAAWQANTMAEWREQGGDYPWQIQLHQGARWARENTPSDAVIGAFDAGILAYYSGRRVVNLDGVINDHAGRAVRERRLFAYMREQDIIYYIDHDPFMRELFKPFFGDPGGLRYGQLVKFDRGRSLNRSPVCVFRLDWSGSVDDR